MPPVTRRVRHAADPQRALQTLPADEIVLFTHAGREMCRLEEALVEKARERFDAQIEHLVVENA
jgi:hypothetical protein